MDFLKNLNTSESLLVVTNNNKDTFTEDFKKFDAVQFCSLDAIAENGQNTISNIIVLQDVNLVPQNYHSICKILKPEGKLHILNKSDINSVELHLKVNGFMNVTAQDDHIVASKPKFSQGSSVKLNLKKPAVWKVEADDEDDLIDPDDLLDEDDLKKPDPSSLKVCGTTGKRKACKDCSCGLAEELATEAQKGKVIDTKDAPKSSCGSCYLGDAFRCASCPYLGMPAFKPGEKIQLTSAQMKSDI